MARPFKTFFIVNPLAGHGRGKKVWDRYHKSIIKRWGRCDFEYTNSRGHGIILTTEALRKGYEMIVAVGGDGTVNEVLNGFFEDGQPVSREAVLGIIPAGTGGDFIRSIDFPTNFADRMRLIGGRETRKIDIGHVTFRTLDGVPQARYFINVAGCGLPGELVDEISKMPRTFGGKVAYLLGLAKALQSHQNAKLTVKIDACAAITKKALCGVISNGQYFGSGMHIAPDAIVDDGWFDFILIGDIKVSVLLRNLPQLYWGNIRNHPSVEVYRAKRVQIMAEREVLLDMDGEQTGRLPATYEIFPKAVRIKI